MWNFLPWWLLRKAMDTGSSLLDGLVSYWPLDEISGVRYDAVGSNDLTDNNTVGAVLRGPEGTVASLVAANSEGLYIPAPGIVLPPQGTVTIWAKVDPAATDGWHAQLVFYNYVLLQCYTVGGKVVYVSGSFYDGANYPSAGSGWGETYIGDGSGWFLLTVTWDGSTYKVYPNSGANSWSTAGGSPLHDPNQASWISYQAQNWDGELAGCGLWSRAISQSEVAALFAAGNGLRYAELTDGLKTGLVSWWELDEVSGVRYDSHGSNDLTDNNTVGSATAVSGAMDGAAASFVEANSEYLDISAGAIPVNSDFTVTFWGWHNDTAGNIAYFPFKTKTTSADQHGIFLEASWSGNHRMYNRRAYGTAVELGDNAGKWVLYLYEYNHATTTTRCMALGSAANSGVWSADSVADLGAATTYFSLLRNEAGVGSVLFRVDEVALWSRVLTADERTELYNLGRGKYYDFS